MHGKVVFTEKSLDAKTSADAVGRVLSGKADYQWVVANGQTWVWGIWLPESGKEDVLIIKPVSLWKRMCKGYEPVLNKDYKFLPLGEMTRPDVGCFGGDDDSDEIEGDSDESPADAPISRAEVVSEAIAEDALDAELEAAAEAELWAMARAESAAAARRMEVAYTRALTTVRRRGAIEDGFLPYVPAYDLAWDTAVFEGEIYRIIDLPF